jgi:hypothetical protein
VNLFSEKLRKSLFSQCKMGFPAKFCNFCKLKKLRKKTLSFFLSEKEKTCIQSGFEAIVYQASIKDCTCVGGILRMRDRYSRLST